jgi:hypothetical protein
LPLLLDPLEFSSFSTFNTFAVSIVLCSEFPSDSFIDDKSPAVTTTHLPPHATTNDNTARLPHDFVSVTACLTLHATTPPSQILTPV